jgi:hypothetical protein
MQTHDPSINEINMVEAEHGSRDLTSTSSPLSRSRRNLPRATHACQLCRAKKAKCDQRQPCSSCLKHSVQCEYGVRRRKPRNKNYRGQIRDRENAVDRPNQLPCPASDRKSRDEPLGGEMPGPTQGPDASGMSLFLPASVLLIRG